jgi:hypothetical protein
MRIPLVERLPAGLLDGEERLARSLRSVLEHLACCARLQDHHAHVVRDDVVQLARDASALLGCGLPCVLLALPLGPLRPELELTRPIPPEPNHPAEAEEHADVRKLPTTSANVRLAGST